MTVTRRRSDTIHDSACRCVRVCGVHVRWVHCVTHTHTVVVSECSSDGECMLHYQTRHQTFHRLTCSPHDLTRRVMDQRPHIGSPQTGNVRTARTPSRVHHQPHTRVYTFCLIGPGFQWHELAMHSDVCGSMSMWRHVADTNSVHIVCSLSYPGSRMTRKSTGWCRWGRQYSRQTSDGWVGSTRAVARCLLPWRQAQMIQSRAECSLESRWLVDDVSYDSRLFIPTARCQPQQPIELSDADCREIRSLRICLQELFLPV